MSTTDTIDQIEHPKSDRPPMGETELHSCVQRYSKKEPPTNQSSPGTDSTIRQLKDARFGKSSGKRMSADRSNDLIDPNKPTPPKKKQGQSGITGSWGCLPVKTRWCWSWTPVVRVTFRKLTSGSTLRASSWSIDLAATKR